MTFSFMIREWYSQDSDQASEDSDQDSEDSDQGTSDMRYHIYLFGMTTDNKTICLDVTDFTPYYYIKMPNHWTDIESTRFVDALKGALWKNSNHLVSSTVMKKKDAYGFSNGREFNFLRLVFNDMGTYRKSMYFFKYKNKLRGYENQEFELYDSTIDPMLVFMHLRNIQASGWVRVENYKKVDNLTRCEINISTKWKNVIPDDNMSIPKFKTMSFDLEVYSFDGTFPKPEIVANYITQIGYTFQRFGDQDMDKNVIVVGDCDPIQGVNVISVKTEKEAILCWVDEVAKNDPDQIIGYNIDNFDWTYLYVRSEQLEILSEVFSGLSRLHSTPSIYKTSKLESNAYGFNSFNYISIPGVGQIDLIHWFRKNTKLDSYKLDFVSSKYLNENKRDVDPKQIFLWSGPNGNSKDRSTVADYCAQDTCLPLKLMLNRCMFPNMIEMSRVTYIPFSWLITRGEQIKAFSQISKELRSNKFVLKGEMEADDEDFEGATVLHCQRGMYFEPVSGLDFASLYPSIMIAHNLCITTWVRDSRYKNIDNVEYKEFPIDDKTKYTFVQSQEGIIPGILKRLWAERKRVKKLMEACNEPVMKSILNAKQLAVKVSMNSIYGVCGAKKGIFCCKAIAASVTYTGRQMILSSKNNAESWYDGSDKCGNVKAVVLYGDSVTGNTPLTIRQNNKLEVVQIGDLGSEWYSFPQFKINEPDIKGKEACNVYNTEIYTNGGWKRIIRVIRHNTKKKLYRVVTERGIVEVTEDHSLILDNLQLIKPKGLKIEQPLLTKPDFWNSK